MIINRIQVLNYGCLRYVDVPMGRFHLLIGPNASGKSTLMDAIKFVSDVVRDGVEAAWMKRTSNFADLVWGRPNEPDKQRFEIALEFGLPDDIQSLIPLGPQFSGFRYQLAVGADKQTGQITLQEERGTLISDQSPRERQLWMFPDPLSPMITIMQRQSSGTRMVFSKTNTGRSRYHPETVSDSGTQGWRPAFSLSADRSAMSILPDNVADYPVTTRVSGYLRDSVMGLSLNSEQMRRASRPGVGTDFLPDGSNMPWVVSLMQAQAPKRAEDWVDHVQGALRGFDSVEVIDRPDDRHRYLMLQYSNGLKVPSWKASDGTLRLLALTVLAYIPQAHGLYMIEEPENGIHPGALQDVFDSLSSVYNAQVLLATHSPEFVAIANVKHLLCFGKTADGVVDIIPGSAHPRLVKWQNETDLGTFFASGILA